jgi:hypothetical protein
VWSVKTLLRLSLKKSNGCRRKDTLGTGCLWTIGHLCLGNFRRRLARVYDIILSITWIHFRMVSMSSSLSFELSMIPSCIQQEEASTEWRKRKIVVTRFWSLLPGSPRSLFLVQRCCPQVQSSLDRLVGSSRWWSLWWLYPEDLKIPNF